MKKYSILILIILTFVVLSGCSSKKEEKEISGGKLPMFTEADELTEEMDSLIPKAEANY